MDRAIFQTVISAFVNELIVQISDLSKELLPNRFPAPPVQQMAVLTMVSNWTESDLQGYISNLVQESSTLDYKAADSLAQTDGKRKEITKDVSSFANSAGGLIIYGIKEYQELGKKHLPEKIDPVNIAQYSKEWLEHVINNIQPRIKGLTIHPVPISSNSNYAVYVVEIPQGHTAHQALDLRYYRRFNYESVPMEDHEIRDVMGRQQSPHIGLEFHIEILSITPIKLARLVIEAKNSGSRYAQYVNCLLYIPPTLYKHDNFLFNKEVKNINGITYRTIRKKNTQRDVIEEDNRGKEKLGSSWFDPILPSLSHRWEWNLPRNFGPAQIQSDERIYWEVMADNSPPMSGSVVLKDLQFSYNRSNTVSAIVAAIGWPKTIGLFFALFLVVIWIVFSIISLFIYLPPIQTFLFNR